MLWRTDRSSRTCRWSIVSKARGLSSVVFYSRTIAAQIYQAMFSEEMTTKEGTDLSHQEGRGTQLGTEPVVSGEFDSHQRSSISKQYCLRCMCGQTRL
jgi:hypothetical protein